MRGLYGHQPSGPKFRIDFITVKTIVMYAFHYRQPHCSTKQAVVNSQKC